MTTTAVKTTRIALAGPAGRLGAAILGAAAKAQDLSLVGGLARPGSAAAGMDLGAFAGSGDLGVAATDKLDDAVADADVLIDVSTAEAAADHARALAARGGPALVVGATGFDDEDYAALQAASEHIPVVYAANFSVGVTVLNGLVRKAAEALSEDWDIEILEMHHRSKADAPSGTALMLGRAAAAARGVDLDERAVRGRAAGEDKVTRKTGEIGFASLRGGGVVGHHEVMFAAQDAMITIQHQAYDRIIFARGALIAARWVAQDRKPGLYTMDDVVGMAG